MKNRFPLIILTFSFIVLFLLSCKKTGVEVFDSDKKVVNILVLGNSFSLDAFSYVPFIVEDLCPDNGIRLWVLYKGGASIAQHVEDHDNYVLYYYEPNRNIWSEAKGYSSEDALVAFPWDMVVLHQVSTSSDDYGSISAQLPVLMDYLETYTHAGVYWLQIPSLPNGSPFLRGKESGRLYNDICSVCDSISLSFKIEGVIPCGTAIESARRSPLDSLGDFGHLSYDGRHLQEGLPCLIESFVCSQFIMSSLIHQGDIYYSRINVSDSWIKRVAIPKPDGVVCGISPENSAVAKRIARNAVNHPYIIMSAE